MDGLPFVGRMPMTDRVWLATGFSAWGLSNGTAAAHLLADLLDGRPNELAAQWDARRWNLKAGGGRFMSNNLEVGREMVGDRISALRAPHSDELARGAGGLVRHQGRLVAAYRDEAGTLTTLSPYCTHLRCLLSWDPAAGLWECPCHGSIFDREGVGSCTGRPCGIFVGETDGQPGRGGATRRHRVVERGRTASVIETPCNRNGQRLRRRRPLSLAFRQLVEDILHIELAHRHHRDDGHGCGEDHPQHAEQRAHQHLCRNREDGARFTTRCWMIGTTICASMSARSDRRPGR
jgi:nitrite reductase/ring-hydroxylating ferredoxin subunit